MQILYQTLDNYNLFNLHTNAVNAQRFICMIYRQGPTPEKPEVGLHEEHQKRKEPVVPIHYPPAMSLI